GPKGAFLQERVPLAELEPVHNDRALAAGIDDDRSPHFLLPAVIVLHPNAHGSGPLEKHFPDTCPLMYLYTMFPSIIDQHFVELPTAHLPSLRALVRFVIDEVERLGKSSILRYELDAVLLDEMAALHLVQEVQALDDPVGLRDKRFADMKARITFPLEKL